MEQGIIYYGKKSKTYGFGDAILETSNTGTGQTSWNRDKSYFPFSTYSFFVRGGYYGSNSTTGSFAIGYTNGNASSGDGGFRSVLVTL